MRYILSIIFIALLLVMAGSMFERPVVIVRSEKLPFKVKLGEEWTVKPPNWDRRDFCIYQPKICTDRMDSNYQDLLISGVNVS